MISSRPGFLFLAASKTHRQIPTAFVLKVTQRMKRSGSGGAGLIAERKNQFE
jgi:hypothetical protein